jgi:tetratricopeptide (TPR) repeat protein
MSKSASASARRRELDPDALAALEEERDFLLRSLEDLEREHAAGDVDDSDFEELKDDYTARAAAAIRAIEDRTAAVKSLLPQRNWQRTALGLVLVGALAVGASWLVFRNAGTRAPGQGLTGDIRQDSSNLILQAQGLTGQAQASLQAGDSAKALKQFESAVQAYDKALEISPENVQAMTYRGWVLHTIALSSELSVAADLDRQAVEYLDEAVAIDPLYSDARVFRAILERNAGEFGAAKADLDAIDMNAIPMYMIQMVNSLREDVAAGRRD